MAFDINETVAQMLSAIKDSVGENWPEAKRAMNNFMERRKARLQLLAEFLLQGLITQDEFNSRLEDEKLLLDSELHAVAIITKSMSQQAANAAIEVLQNAVITAIKIL